MLIILQEFAGKRVLVVGSGESGSDICNEISKYAASTGLAIRGKHGHLIPRKQADGRVTDLNTNRCRYSNPYILGDWVGYVNQLVSFASDGDYCLVCLFVFRGPGWLYRRQWLWVCCLVSVLGLGGTKEKRSREQAIST